MPYFFAVLRDLVDGERPTVEHSFVPGRVE
jgi:hypothetical protein